MRTLCIHEVLDRNWGTLLFVDGRLAEDVLGRSSEAHVLLAESLHMLIDV